jgi:8-oxo-dGTP pyrophosphatase MutT (NUDIX family)
MKVVYALESFPSAVTKTLFLAGPTPRGTAISWREEALRLLEELGYDGHVFVPEPKEGFWAENYINQVEWEDEFLRAADVILFWVPRDMKGAHPEGNGSVMAGLTTNDEWGVWKHSGKVVWGAPDWADHVSYQRHYTEKLKVPKASTLKGTLELALEKLGDGAPRTDIEAKVPAFVWTRPEFSAWLTSQHESGNKVEDLDVQWTLWVGPKRDRLFLYVVHAVVEVTEEGRKKSNECVLFRPDISTVCLYKLAEPLTDSKIVLVREFRTPVRNSESFVYELPGGSSPKEGVEPRQTAADEVSEELGFAIDPSRLKELGSRQMGATLLGYHAHLFAAELTDAELAKLEADRGVHGADAEERTYVRVVTLKEVLRDNLVDWPTLGMVFGSFALG